MCVTQTIFFFTICIFSPLRVELLRPQKKHPDLLDYIIGHVIYTVLREMPPQGNYTQWVPNVEGTERACKRLRSPDRKRVQLVWRTLRVCVAIVGTITRVIEITTQGPLVPSKTSLGWKAINAMSLDVKKQPSQDVLHGDEAEEELGLARLVSSYTLPHQNSQPGGRGRQTARSKVLSRRARDT